MQFEVSDIDKKKARQPHELFLINLVFNHILLFISFLGMFNDLPFLLAIVPILSVSILVYTIFRAKKSLTTDPWFVMCHWQVCAKRSRMFLMMLGVLTTIFIAGWIGYSVLEMKKVAVFALIGGIGILPTMVTVLTLIIIESDTMHQAGEGKLAKWLYEKYPNSEIKVISE